MKKRNILGCIICISCIALVGCSANGEKDTDIKVQIESEMDVQSAVKTSEEEQTTIKAQEELTFEDLSKYSYCFASGAGGWSTDFDIEKDGTFHGGYHDSDMGSTGEGYSNGTYYVCSFQGRFKNLKKINDLCYEMELDTVSFADEVGKEEIMDDMLYVYTEWYGLEGTDVYKIYLPGTLLSDLTEEVRMWIQMANEVDAVLDRPIIVNEPQQYGIYSYERMSAKEEAEMLYNSYQDSYNFYLEKVQDAYTTMEMFENANNRYRVADDCLNELWRVLKYNVSEEKFQIILEEQREWIKTKEAAGENAAADFEGGSFAPVSRMDIMADETMARCGILCEYIKEYAQ